jgi:hypothetical protein
MFKKSFILKFMSLWPPFFGAGIRVKNISDNMRSIYVEMKLHFWNQNYVGTQYGGSLFSMTDPFLMLMLLENLGSEFIVWDKVATIRFKKPCKGTVHVHFKLTPERIEEIREQALNNTKVEPVFTVLIQNSHGETVAEVEKTLYVKRKNRG